MNNTKKITLGTILFLVVFWLGLLFNFPGGALSRYIESQVNRDGNVEVSLGEASLGLLGLGFPSLSVSINESGSKREILVLEDVSIPFSWRLISGLPVSADHGKEGWIQAFVSWDLSNIEVEGGDLLLQEMKAWKSFAPMTVTGKVDLNGQFSFPAGKALNGSLPKGSLKANAGNIEIANLDLMGTKLPQAKLELIDLELESGSRIQVKKLVFNGDIKGTVSGTIQPAGNVLNNARLDLQLSAALRHQWVESFPRTFQIILKSMLKDNSITGKVGGTLGNPRWQKSG